MRILKALGVQPRRTIRMALWDAEEQGFVGSRGYVANHFYDLAKKEKKPEYDQLAAYFNFDNGSGKIRGIYAQGNSAVAPVFEDWLNPVRDLGAATVTLRTRAERTICPSTRSACRGSSSSRTTSNTIR